MPLGPGDGRYCGSRLPGVNGTIVSTRSAVFLQFRWEVARTPCHHLSRSDHSVNDHGFHLSWNTSSPQCGEVVAGASRGMIQSPGYPGNYPHNAHCTWTIRVDYGKRIQFQFAVLRLESHPNCSYDRWGGEAYPGAAWSWWRGAWTT